MSLLQELQRRNVFRIALAYILTTWLLLQVADVVLNNIGAPDWVFKAMLLVLALGFLPAVLFAWAYELTPEGVKREKDVDRTQSVTHMTGRKLDRTIIIVLLLAVGYFAYDKSNGGSARDKDTLAQATSGSDIQLAQQGPAGTTAQDNSSIAVLPFVNMSSDAEQEYFSDGISEELLNLLAKIPEFRVAGRTSSFAFKGRNDDLRHIGKSLGVANILEGSVRKSGNRVRITAQLVQVEDGFHLWSETYDRELTDIFAVQDEISAAVVRELKVTLLGEQPRRSSADALMANTDAYNLYLHGRYFFNQRGPDNQKRAMGYFEKALTLAPDSALAWAALSNSSVLYAGQSDEEPAPVLARAREAAAKALALDNALPEAYLALASIKKSFDWDWQGAEQATRRALELRPGDVMARHMLGVLLSTYGRSKEALSIIAEAQQQDPLDKPLQLALAGELYNLNRFLEAEKVIQGLLEKDASDSVSNGYMGWILFEQGRLPEALGFFERESIAFMRLTGNAVIYQRLGEQDKALAAQQQFLEKYGDLAAYQQAQIYAMWGDPESAASWLQRAYESRDPGMTGIKTDSAFKDMQDNPVYKSLLAKMNIPD